MFKTKFSLFKVDCIVATAGGVEEDFIKCLGPTYLGKFELDGKTLRDQGINRIGNLLVPNSNYCLFEDWLMPKLDVMLQEQKEKVFKLSNCDIYYKKLRNILKN